MSAKFAIGRARFTGPTLVSMPVELNGANSSFDLSDAVRIDPMPFGSDLLRFSPECFGNLAAEGSDAREEPDGTMFEESGAIGRAA